MSTYNQEYRKTEAYRVARAKYLKSPKGKIVLARYRKSDKYRAMISRYKKSPKGMATISKYGKSEKATLSRQSYNARWTRTPWGKFRSYRNGSKTRGLVFKLTFEQFLSFWQKPCHYCGEAIETIGLDRVDSSKGYTIDNVVSCCIICNKGKLDMGVVSYLEHCRKVVNHCEGK